MRTRHSDLSAVIYSGAGPSPEVVVRYAERAREVMEIEIAGLDKVRRSIGAEFERAVDLVLACLGARGKIVVTGVGKNFHIAEKISATLASTGSTSVAMNPSQALHGDLGILSQGDVLLALSYSGESEEILALVPTVTRSGVHLISITGDPASTLAKASAAVLDATVDREACPFNMAPTTSTTATLALGDALAMVLLEARGFKVADYAKLHPGGAIGRTLLLRVSDIMRTGDRVARVVPSTRIRDVMLAMTNARAGSAGVVDAQDRVLGVFTDGDLRRNLARFSDLLTMPVGEVMTASPITVTGDQLAVEVLKIFEDHRIDDILVVDGERRLIGAIDSQDLPKLKIL